MIKKSFFLSSLFWISCRHTVPQPAVQACNTSYETDVKPIINTKCTIDGCHGSNGLADLDNFEALKIRADNGNIYKYVFTLQMMPPSNASQMTEDEKRILKCWLDNGAKEN